MVYISIFLVIFIIMIKYILLLIIFVQSTSLFNSRSEFELIKVTSSYGKNRVVFYNIIKTEYDEVFIGSSIGVLKWTPENLTLKDKSVLGNMKISSKKRNGYYYDNALIDEINTSKKFNYLLPAEYNNHEIPFASIDNYLLLVVNGKLYLFNKLNYIKSLKGKSIRSISKNYVGTYTGIYKNNKLQVDLPNYTNSYIREFGNEVIVNYDGISLKDSIRVTEHRGVIGNFEYDGIDLGYALDVFKFKNIYILFTTKGIWRTTFKNKPTKIVEFEEVNRMEIENTPKFIDFIESNDKEPPRILFYAEKSLELLNLNNFEATKIKTILNGAIDIKRRNNSTYWIDKENLNTLDTNNQIISLLSNTYDFHTLYPINNNLIVLTSDLGLFKFNIQSKELTKVIDNEFNRLALYQKNDTLYIGGVDGLIKYSIKDIIAFKPIKFNSSIDSLYVTITVLSSIIVILIILYFNKKTVKIEQNTPSIEDQINDYITNNLSSVSVVAIQKEFNISYRQLSNIYKPFGPGKKIQQLRTEKTLKMIAAGDNLNLISNTTGYSIGYIKKYFI